MKVVAINQFHSDNIGDKLIGKSIKEFFEDKVDVIEISGYSQVYEQEIVTHSNFEFNNIFERLKRHCPSMIKYILRYRKDILDEIKKIEFSQFDALIIGGGQLIKHKGVFPYCFSLWCKMAIEYNIPIYVYGVGVDDDISAMDAVFYKYGLENARYVCCRDKKSAQNLMRFFKGHIDVSPDVVFSLKKRNNSFKNNLVVMPYCFETAKSHFGTLKNRNDYYKMILDVIRKELFDKLILTATTSADLRECYMLGEFLKTNDICFEIAHAKDEIDLFNIYSYAKKVYTGRMHAMIMAMLVDVEIIPMRISPKICDFESLYLNSRKPIDEIIEASNAGLTSLYKIMEQNYDKHSNTTV